MNANALPELNPPQRLLLGPGPSMVSPRVLRAMSTPLLGHLDPKFLEIMNEVQAQLRLCFRTQNQFTVAMSGTGSAGMESALVNFLEPGDKAIIVIGGVFGTRQAEIARRCGAEVTTIEVPWGETCDHAKIAEALKKLKPVKLVGIVHAETSTGAQQPIEGLGKLCQEHGALLMVDTVTSLGGVPVEVDTWGVDVCYSGTQKCLSCPPGLAPLTLSQRALDVVKSRKTKVQSWYLDVSMIADYWAEGKRAYHHTAPISMVYALCESLRIVLEEGLEARFIRHRKHSAALIAGLSALGCVPLAPEGRRLPSLNCVRVPDGVEEAAVRKLVLNDHNIEIGGGLGPLVGKVWRIGLMGESCQQSSVLSVLAALEQSLAKIGRSVKPGVAVGAALDHYAKG